MNIDQITRFKEKYPDRIPIIVVKYENGKEQTESTELTKSKFLVPKQMLGSMFLQVLRKYIKVAPEESLLFFVDNTFMMPMHRSMAEIHKEYLSCETIKEKEETYLKLTYSKENVFGFNFS